MGRALSAGWPELLRTQDAENRYLRAQLAPGTYWNVDPPERFSDQRAPILGQVALGTAVSDWLRVFGIGPTAMLGYSLGESAGLFALRAWTDRDEMLHRLNVSPLFRTELAGPCEAARRAWGIAPGGPVEWRAGIVPCPAETVRAALEGRSRVYLLIVNTPGETVIGGARAAVERLVGDLGCPFLPLPVVSTVHCPLARPVEAAYRALHTLATTPPPGIAFYSGASGAPTPSTARPPPRPSSHRPCTTIDFPRVVERAYADGVRVFIEVGPGGSCTRLISATLGDRPHLARTACLAGHDPLSTLLDLLGRLIAERVRVDLGTLYGQETHVVGHRLETPAEAPARMLTVAVGGRPFEVPPPPALRSAGPGGSGSGGETGTGSGDVPVPIFAAAADVVAVNGDSTSKTRSQSPASADPFSVPWTGAGVLALSSSALESDIA